MDSPVREMEEMDEFVLVPEAADLRAYQVDEDADDAHDHEARFLAGNNEKTIDVNYYASEPTSDDAAQCGMAETEASWGAESEGTVEDDVEAADGDLSDDDEGLVAEEVGGVAEEPERKESEGSVEDDVEDVDGGLSDGDDGVAAEEVGVAENQPERKDREGDHGWQQHAVGVICSVGLAAAATGLALLLGGQQQTQRRVRLRVDGDRKESKVSEWRGARRDQEISVPRFVHAPAIISFGGSYDGLRF